MVNDLINLFLILQNPPTKMFYKRASATPNVLQGSKLVFELVENERVLTSALPFMLIITANA